MHTSIILSTVLVALCCVNYVAASGYGVDCACTCCVSSKSNACTAFSLGSAHLDLPSCDNSQCLAACRKQYPLCESGKSIMQTTCSGSEPDTTTTTMASSTASSSTSGSTAPLTSTSTQTSTPGSTASLTSTSTQSSTSTSSSITITTPSTPWPTRTSSSSSTVTSSTTSAGSTSTTPSKSSSGSTTPAQPTTSPTSTGAINSIFQLSHLIAFSVVLSFLCM